MFEVFLVAEAPRVFEKNVPRKWSPASNLIAIINVSVCYSCCLFIGLAFANQTSVHACNAANADILTNERNKIVFQHSRLKAYNVFDLSHLYYISFYNI